ncbi:MAG: hypothetical protein ACRD2L_02845 [Terriglobia bacterium]
MPAAIAPALIGGAAALYVGSQAKKAASKQSDIARQALDASNRPRGTQYGSYTGLRAGETFTSIDPSIRAMRERSLENIPSYQGILRPQLQSALEGLGQTRGRLEELYGQTNDNAFMDPILQRLALARGEVTRGLTNRGLGGSSLYSNALGNFESAAAPGIAQARQQALQARQGILGDIANTAAQGVTTAGAGVANLQNLDNLYANVSGQNLEQELAALGLSATNIQGILGAAQQIGQAGQQRAAATGGTLAALGDIFGGINFGGQQQQLLPLPQYSGTSRIGH